MNSLRSVKDTRKSSSPLKTPEKPLPYKQVNSKKSVVKPNPVPKKIIFRKSLNQMAYIEELKQQSLRTVEGIEKLRRIIAFSKYRPCFKSLKSIFYDEFNKIKNFVYMKTLLKAWEVLKTTQKSTKICKIINKFNFLYYSQSSVSNNVYNRKLKSKAFNSLLNFYCYSAEISQMLNDFYNKKLQKKSFSALNMNSKYDDAVDSFYKVMHN